MHPAFYIGVVGLMIGGMMFGWTFGSKSIGRDTCWIVVIGSIITAMYGAFAGRKDQLTGSGKKMKDTYV
jgi:hypothetical protein